MSLTILTVTNNENGVKGLSLLKEEQEKIQFLNFKIVLIDDCNSYKDYNRRSVCNVFDYFDTDFVLIVQFDGRILNPNAWTNDFFKYDYIGAPWWDNVVGNGGFCLRSKKFCSVVSKSLSSRYPYGHNEDDWMCRRMRKEFENAGILFAPYDAARRFSVENKRYDGSFGAHDHVVVSGKRLSVKNDWRKIYKGLER